MRIWQALAAGVILAAASMAAAQRPPDLAAAAAELVKADAEFAKAVADRNRDRFLSFIADVTTFAGGSANELRSRTPSGGSGPCSSRLPVRR